MVIDCHVHVSACTPGHGWLSPTMLKGSTFRFMRWKFSPPQIDGHPAPSAWILHFQFGRTLTQVSQTQL